jgi:hypothetical protein
MCKALLPSAIEIATDLDRGQVNAEGRSLRAPHQRKQTGMGGRVYQAGVHGPVLYKLITSAKILSSIRRRHGRDAR